MRSWDKLSLRARLSLLYTVLLVFSVVLIGCYSYWNIRQLFISNKSSLLRARAKPIIEHWLIDNDLVKADNPHLKLNPQNAFILARDLTSRDTVAIVLNRKGDIIANGKRLPEEPQAPISDKRYFRRALSGENEVTYRSQVNGRPVLVLLIPLRAKPASPRILGVIQMSTLLTDIREILFRQGAMLVSLVAIILILGIVTGFWLIGVSLKDLQGLLTSCNQISKGNFSLRVPVKNRRDEIGQLAISFNQMIEKLQATFASQQRFVANAAHELMTPLTGLRGSLEVLLRGAQDDPSATARLSKGMYREVNRLIRLCEQLLGLSQLESSSNVHKQPIILSNFFNDFIADAQVLAGGRSLTFQEGPYVKVSADPDLLKQVLLNLLSNALRYSPTETPVVISWKLLPGRVEIRVSDQGQGMDAETLSHAFRSPDIGGPWMRHGQDQRKRCASTATLQLEARAFLSVRHVSPHNVTSSFVTHGSTFTYGSMSGGLAFEPFYQGKTTVVSGDKGIGLGLSLARSMIEAHEGTIRIKSEPGKGTTVSFALPLK